MTNINPTTPMEKMTMGGSIYNAGNAKEFKTGDWRSTRPVFLSDKCKQCGLCFPVCPDDAIPVNKDLKREDFDFDYCKGCGVCAKVCPFGAIEMKATSSNGLSLMWEMIYIASSLRLPIVLSLVNRAVSGPLNIHNDHSDAMGVRDAGWIMLFSENNQEAYDNTLMAHRIAENKNVMLPLMVCQDGFITSHSIENIELEDDENVKQFIGQYHPEHYLLNQK